MVEQERVYAGPSPWRVVPDAVTVSFMLASQGELGSRIRTAVKEYLNHFFARRKKMGDETWFVQAASGPPRKPSRCCTR